MKILTVDDDLTVRILVSNIFGKEGHYVKEAADGLVAIDILTNEIDFDLILLDWEMPELDGLTFLKKIKNTRVAPNTKVVMLTGCTKLSNVMRAMEVGADGYIMKPFTKEILLEKVNEIM